MGTNYLQYGRKWRLLVGPVSDTADTPSTTSSVGPAKEWDELRTVFEVWQTGDSSPNKANIEIFNLSHESREFITSSPRDTTAVQIYAGYGDHVPLLFTGNLELGTSSKRGKLNHHHEGPDWCTKIEGRDGIRAYRSTILTLSFNNQATDASILQRLASEMSPKGSPPIKLNDVRKANKGKPIAGKHGRQFTGPAKYELDAICRSKGVRWSIQNGNLNILPYAAALDQPDNAIIISPSSGLVGSATKTEKGVMFTTLLNGTIHPGRLFQIQSEDFPPPYTGYYVAENVRHRGDTHGQDWYTHVEAIEWDSNA